MKVKTILFFILLPLLTSCGVSVSTLNKKRPKGYTGEWDPYYCQELYSKPIYPTDDQRNFIETNYNSIPMELLKLAEKDLDSTIWASKCYKFIPSPDSTKFLAFFVGSGHIGSHSKKYGSSTILHNNIYPSLPTFRGYVLWGMQYEEYWYFDKGSTYTFSDSVLEKAKADFLYYTLQDQHFFKDFLTPSHNFWNRGGGGVQFLPLRPENYLSVYGECYAGLPVIVANGKKAYRWKTKDVCLAWFDENIANIMEYDSLLFSYYDPNSHYNRLHIDLISVELDKLLMSFQHKDHTESRWVSFLYFQLENDSIENVYLWNKSFSIPKNVYVGALIPFYEEFIPGWNYVTEVHCDSSFWAQHVELKENGGYKYLKSLNFPKK